MYRAINNKFKTALSFRKRGKRHNIVIKKDIDDLESFLWITQSISMYCKKWEIKVINLLAPELLRQKDLKIWKSFRT